MSDRGEYRSLFVAFADDPDVHALSGDAVKLYTMLKLSLPPTGLGVFYWSKLQDQMRCERPRIEELLAELAAPRTGSDRGWLLVERNVAWIIEALADEPHLKHTNAQKHVPFIRRLVAGVDPRLSVVRAFKAHYAAWFQGVSEPNPNPSDTQANDYQDGTDTQSSDGETKGNDRVSKQIQEEEEAVAQQGTTDSSSSSSRERLLDLVPDRRAWEGEFDVAQDGAYGPRYKASDEQIETACRDYIGNGFADKPNLAHFRACLRRIVVADAERAATPATPATPAAKTRKPAAAATTSTSEYGKHFE